MSTKPVLLLAFALSLAGSTAGADENPLTVSDVVALVLQNSASVLKAEKSLQAAVNQYKSVMAQKVPQASLSTSYRLDYTTERQDMTYVGTTDFGAALTNLEDYRLHTVMLGVSMDQLLPTSGVLSVSLVDQITARLGTAFISTASEELDPYFSQTPTLALSLTQPVFVNGKFIDPSLHDATFRKAEITRAKVTHSNRLERNSAVLEAVSTLFDIVNLRNDIATTQQATELKQRGLESLQFRLEQGLVAETQVWAMRVEIGKERERLLRQVYSLRDLEGKFRLALGLADERVIAVAEDLFIPSVDLGTIKEPEQLFRDNPVIRRYALAAEGARLDAILEGGNGASQLSVSLSLQPRYGSLRPYGKDATLGESLSDYGNSDSGFDIGLAATLDVPLYNGSRWASRVEAGKAVAASAGQDLVYQKKHLLFSVRQSLLLQENLRERIPLLEDNIALRKKEAEVERDLLGVGQSTELDVIELEIGSIQKQNELTKVKMDLYLTILNILSLTGADLETAVLQND